jgi:hypothetical protein
MKVYKESTRYRDECVGKEVFVKGEMELLKGETVTYRAKRVKSVIEKYVVMGDMWVTNFRVVWGGERIIRNSLSLPYVVMQKVEIEEKGEKNKITICVARYNVSRDVEVEGSG